MKQRGLLQLQPGSDGRERVVALTTRAEAMVPALEAHWAATSTAAATLDDELPMPLSALVQQAIAALEKKSFAQRLRQAAQLAAQLPRASNHGKSGNDEGTKDEVGLGTT